jgi:CRISPR-associated protein Csd1
MNHLSKIRKDVENKNLAFFYEKQIGDIQKNMGTSWPRNLALLDQGRFAIGYYHQRFTRKIKDASGEEIENLAAIDAETEQSETAAEED